MKIPIAYNLRNLAVRKTSTLMTAIGIGLTVAVLVSALALVTDCEPPFRTQVIPSRFSPCRRAVGLN